LRQPFEHQREFPDQHVAEHENRNRESGHGKDHDAPVDPGVRFPGRHDPHGHRNQNREDDGGQRQHEGRLEALGDQVGDRQIAEDRDAEIALHQGPDPGAELDHDRFVEAKLFANKIDVFRRSVGAGDYRRRIAR